MKKTWIFSVPVEFVIIIEPSRLMTTAQLGLRSLAQYCYREGGQLTYLSTDKNCDGLVDALSHVMMTSFEEVSPTNRHRGLSSFMSWETDEEYLQHRMLPNISRYLGMGTEFSFVALKNQIPETSWYGGEAFPVVDMRWIARQYYFELLHYANLPISQETMNEVFRVSANPWNAKVHDNSFLTVEDESYNIFESRRVFATRAQKQGFINIISSEYMLKEYMAQNEAIFNADPKAIPYLIADYARTNRNVALRLCMRMSCSSVTEQEVYQELTLIHADTSDLRESLWHEICSCLQPIGTDNRDHNGRELLQYTVNGRVLSFDSDTIQVRRRFSIRTGSVYNEFRIVDDKFIRKYLGNLGNAEYVAENENGEYEHLGSELMGQVLQKYLPGQFLTFNGKYYEMTSVVDNGPSDTAARGDHIHGRPSYRRSGIISCPNYRFYRHGGIRDIDGLRIIKQYANIRVETPAYWQMVRYNDFGSGHKVNLNSIPAREYCNKQVLRLELPVPDEEDAGKICYTFAVLLNELFRTLFAENQCYISAMVPGEASEPLTYGLTVDNPESNVIYIVEDSQLELDCWLQ